MATKKTAKMFLYLRRDEAENDPRLREGQLMIHSLCEGIERKAQAAGAEAFRRLKNQAKAGAQMDEEQRKELLAEAKAGAREAYDRVVWEECFLLLIQHGRHYDARLRAVDEAGRRAQGDERVRANAELAKIMSSKEFIISPLWVRQIVVDQSGHRVSEADILQMMKEAGGEVELRKDQRIETTLESSLRIILELFKLRKGELVKGRQQDYVMRLVKAGCLKAKTANAFWKELGHIEQSFAQVNAMTKERRWDTEQAAINAAVAREAELLRLESEKKASTTLEQEARSVIKADAVKEKEGGGGPPLKVVGGGGDLSN